MLELRRLPTLPMVDLRREIDRLFNGYLSPETHAPFTARPFPALNLWEDGDRLFAEAEVPGLDLNDLEILIQGNELTVKGQRKPLEGADVVYHRRERGTGEFTRFLTLPIDVDPDRVEAVMKDGVLTIVMPKAEHARARKITVKTA
jgi:HSP20 family protein